MTDDNTLLPFIRTIENTQSLTKSKKAILCLLVASLPMAPEGLAIHEIQQNTGLALTTVYKGLHALEKEGLVNQNKKLAFTYATVNLATIEQLPQAQTERKNLMSHTLKLRYKATHIQPSK